MCRRFLPPNDLIMPTDHLKGKAKELAEIKEYARAAFEIARYQQKTSECDCSECKPGLLQRIFG